MIEIQILKILTRSDFDQLWLFAVDIESALTDRDAFEIQSFRERGGGVMATRDHEDMGDSLLKLGLLGAVHNFHSSNCELDPLRHHPDDKVTDYISWPNYHSGANGDYQTVATPNSQHPLVKRANGEPIEFLPAHPHEGVVSVPKDAKDFANEILIGRSAVTNHAFGCAIAIENERNAQGVRLGRAVLQSTFHHFADPNLDVEAPLPSFVTEKSGTGMRDNPQALSDSLRYIANVAAWL